MAFVSHDQGATWPEYVHVMNDPTGNIIYWESKIIEMPDGTLLAAAWAYDESTGQDLPNQYVLSGDGGATWSVPQNRVNWTDGELACPGRWLDTDCVPSNG